MTIRLKDVVVSEAPSLKIFAIFEDGEQGSGLVLPVQIDRETVSELREKLESVETYLDERDMDHRERYGLDWSHES
jgi:hypothetical protein